MFLALKTVPIGFRYCKAGRQTPDQHSHRPAKPANLSSGLGTAFRLGVRRSWKPLATDSNASSLPLVGRRMSLNSRRESCSMGLWCAGFRGIIPDEKAL